MTDNCDPQGDGQLEVQNPKEIFYNDVNLSLPGQPSTNSEISLKIPSKHQADRQLGQTHIMTAIEPISFAQRTMQFPSLGKRS